MPIINMTSYLGATSTKQRPWYLLGSTSTAVKRSARAQYEQINGGKLPGNSKHFFKTSKDNAVPEKRSFKR